MKKPILFVLFCLLTIIVIVNCKWGGGNDDTQFIDKVTDVQLEFYYHTEDDINQILDHLISYTTIHSCDNKRYIKYFITLNSIGNNRIDTVISKPNFSANVDKNNYTLNKNWAEKCLKEFKGRKLIENPNQFLTDDGKFLHDSMYLSIISRCSSGFFFKPRRDGSTFETGYNTIVDLDTLKYAIDTSSCSGIGKISIIWNPRIAIVDTGSDQIKTIVTLPENREAQNSRKATLGSRTNLTWKENYELASLKAESHDRIESIWTYLNTAAKMAIDANESDSIYLDIQLPIVESRFSRIRSDSPGKWRGLRAGLDRGDKNLIGVILGPTSSPNANGCFPVNLLVPYTESSTGNFNPQYKLTTTSLNRQGSLVFNFGLLIENRNEWESKDNISLPSGGNITMDYKVSKKKVTIENYTNPGNSYATLCIRFMDESGDIDNGDSGNDSGKLDNNMDSDHDGFIGYLDINDRDSLRFPILKFPDTYLEDNFGFQVTNGESLSDVEYRWYINGNFEEAPYVFRDIGCYDIKLKMTHSPTGKTKEISRTLLVKLPIPDLERDLNAILRVGSYILPAVPPSSEKLKADEAEKRVLSYFAAGCNHTVTNQFNQQKSIQELLVADLRGAKGKIHNIKVKSIAYKNNGCNKICSFVYEIGQ